MAVKELDCIGMACPSPVLKTKELIDAGGADTITVKVDNAAASENVSRFLGRFGYRVSVGERDGVFAVTGSRNGSGAEAAAECEVFIEPAAAPEKRKILVFIGSDKLGSGDDELGARLVASFIGTLKEMGGDLWRLVFVNSGVRLTVEDSPVLEDLRELEDAGVSILVCGTCLNHFGLVEKKRVGETTNMLDIVTSLQIADNTVNLT